MAGETILTFFSDIQDTLANLSVDRIYLFCQTHYIFITGIVSAAVGLRLLRAYFTGGVCHCASRLDGKTVVITGANTGIGKETARDLATRGARIVLGCRDMTKGEKAAQEIREESGNGNVSVRQLDLSSLESVRRFARQILENESHVHILMNNAGIMMCPHWKSTEGYELQFAVNHLGHFLLTNLLLGRVQSSAPSRIITLSSLAHTGGKIHFDDISLEKSYSPFEAYAQSKLANILFTRELSRRMQGTGVTVNVLHPGSVMTELGRYMPDAGFPGWALKLSYPLLYFFSKTPLQGAQTSIHCAVSEELNDVSGLYFSDCAVKEPSLRAKNDEDAKRLWNFSVKMVGLERD